MTEIKIIIEASALAEAINHLADALKVNPISTLQADTPKEADAANLVHPTEPLMTTASETPTAEPVVETQQTITEPVSTPESTIKHYTFDDIKNAGQVLLSAGKMNELTALLGKNGVQSITQLKPEQYDVVALGLKELGASI